MSKFIQGVQKEIEELELKMNQVTERMMQEMEEGEAIPYGRLNEINHMQANLWLKRRNLIYIVTSEQ